MRIASNIRFRIVSEPGEMEVHSDAQHDLSADHPTAADRQPESSAERDQAAATDEPSSVADAEHEPSVQPLGPEQHAEPVDEQQQHAGRSPAPARPTDAVGSADVRSHAAEPDEWELEGPVGRRVHLLEPAASSPHEHGAKSIHAVEEQRKFNGKVKARIRLNARIKSYALWSEIKPVHQLSCLFDISLAF